MSGVSDGMVCVSVGDERKAPSKATLSNLKLLRDQLQELIIDERNHFWGWGPMIMDVTSVVHKRQHSRTLRAIEGLMIRELPQCGLSHAHLCLLLGGR